MAHADLDMREVFAFAADLDVSRARVDAEAEKVVSKGSLNVKKAAREKAPHGPHTPHYENSINYDIYREQGVIVGEIGPAEGRRQWGLGNLLEYGSAHNPPHPHHEPALDEEEPRFYAAAEGIIPRVLHG